MYIHAIYSFKKNCIYQRIRLVQFSQVLLFQWSCFPPGSFLRQPAALGSVDPPPGSQHTPRPSDPHHPATQWRHTPIQPYTRPPAQRRHDWVKQHLSATSDLFAFQRLCSRGALSVCNTPETPTVPSTGPVLYLCVFYILCTVYILGRCVKCK